MAKTKAKAKPLNLELLAKVWALADRGIGGEAEAARNRVRAMIEPHGYDLDDVPGLLSEAEGPEPSAGGFTFYNMNNPAHREAWSRNERAKQRIWERENADKIAEVVSRYGSREAAFASTDTERMLDAAVEPFRGPRKEGDFQRWDGESYGASERVAEAIGRVLPWPQTIPDALAEYEQWESLWDDRNIADGNMQCEYLSEGGDIRRDHLKSMIEHLLRPRDLSDMIVRMKFLIGLDVRIDKPEALLTDLEHLKGLAEQRGSIPAGDDTQRPDPTFGDSARIGELPAGEDGDHSEADRQPRMAATATQRRAEVERIILSPEGDGLSLRQIARRAGVSPQTVANIRSRTGHPKVLDLNNTGAES